MPFSSPNLATCGSDGSRLGSNTSLEHLAYTGRGKGKRRVQLPSTKGCCLNFVMHTGGDTRHKAGIQYARLHLQLLATPVCVHETQNSPVALYLGHPIALRRSFGKCSVGRPLLVTSRAVNRPIPVQSVVEPTHAVAHLFVDDIGNKAQSMVKVSV